MTLLENIYHHLHNNGLVNNREHFSKQYLGKSKNWYAVQTHEGRDFSTSAAIECLKNIKSPKSALENNTPHEALLAETVLQLEDYIKSRISVRTFTLE